MKHIHVTPGAPCAHDGLLRFGTHRARCALGRAGVTANKVEGDKKTPLSSFQLRRIWYRPDRITRPENPLPTIQISPKSGWCDDVHANCYNRPIRRPSRFNHERLWRNDRLYDVFFELGYNDAPAKAGAGSAIFLHLEKANFQPTLGCIAVSHASMAYLLRHATPDTMLTINKKSS